MAPRTRSWAQIGATSATRCEETGLGRPGMPQTNLTRLSSSHHFAAKMGGGGAKDVFRVVVLLPGRKHALQYDLDLVRAHDRIVELLRHGLRA